MGASILRLTVTVKHCSQCISIPTCLSRGLYRSTPMLRRTTFFWVFSTMVLMLPMVYAHSQSQLVPKITSSYHTSLTQQIVTPHPVSFDPAINYDAGYSPRRLVKGDFNNDTNVDLAVPNWYGYQISVLLGTGSGTFPNIRSVSNGANPFA